MWNLLETIYTTREILSQSSVYTDKIYFLWIYTSYYGFVKDFDINEEQLRFNFASTIQPFNDLAIIPNFLAEVAFQFSTPKT